MKEVSSLKLLEEANVILAAVTLGSVMSPILPPPAVVTVNLKFTAPQFPPELSVAVKTEV